ncbi:MAG: M28 family peptidase [Elusimicrobia bacterium]|nr:M28 family peptidase [Elusimicrobiota bacterium]
MPDPNDPSKLDERTFKGRAMTYYGRWTYKYEIASELGAAAALIIHETGPAGYPYEVVRGSFGREQFDLRAAAPGPERVPFEGWLSSATAQRVLAMAGRELAELKAAALRRDFAPVPLGVSIEARVQNTVREVDSANVVARLPGSDPARQGEHVAYVAHWDHLGVDEGAAGDRIFNGAVDNASGVAGLLELAGAMKRLPKAPSRSALFIATTAEEKGLLGARHYAERPLYPLATTVAVLNMDALNVWAPTRDLIFLGQDLSTLGDFAVAAAKPEGRVLKPDPEPEKGLFFRSDHFPFSKAGVPALSIEPGIEAIGKPEGWGLQKRKEYTAKDYHKPSDEVKPDWDLSGLAQDLRVVLRVGLGVAEAERYPEWNAGSEFKAARERSLKP